MAISIACPCGKRLRVADELVGKRCKCPGCGTVLAIRTPVAGDSGPAAAGSARAQAPRPPVRAAAKRLEDEVLDVLPADHSKAADEYDLEPAHQKPRKKKKIRKGKAVPEKTGFFHGFDFGFERSASKAGMAAGILMMVGAVVWFVCGIVYMDRIFFYPPILFVVGLVALIRGAVSRL
jgi:hypothetical protein